MVTLVDLLYSTYAPVQTMLLAYLDIASVVALTKTCKAFAELQPLMKVTAYNVNNLFQRFSADPTAFRSVQRDCAAIVAGKGVHEWIRRTGMFWNRVTVYVAEDASSGMIAYLEKEGYQLTSSVGDKSKYRHMENGEDLQVLLYHSTDAAIVQLFRRCLVTAGLCFITWNKAYVLFPYSTFVGAEFFLLTEFSKTFSNTLESITQEGIKMKTIAWTHVPGGNDSYNQDSGDLKELTRYRRTGDRHTWMMDLETDGISKPDIPTAVLESATFRLQVADVEV